MTQEDHFDVASYALGVLDMRDASRFEDHLIDCPRCAYELDSFVQVADLLGQVDAGAVIAAEESRRDGVVLQKVIGEVRHERQRSNSRRLYSLAAAVVVFAMLSIGAFFVGGQVGGDRAPATNAGSTATTKSDNGGQVDGLSDTGTGIGIGGTELPGKRYDGEDSRTGAKLAVGLEAKDFGTQVSVAVANVKGPIVCQLVVKRSDGSSEPLGSWKVGEQGPGTAASAVPVLWQAKTATPREQISSIQIQDVATGTSLVSAPDS